MDETALVFTDFLTPSDLTSLSAASAWTGASVVPIVDSGAWKKISLTTLFTAPTIAGNATFTGAIISPTIGPASGQQHTLPAVTSDTVALIAASQTLTNKTISGSANTRSRSAERSPSTLPAAA
jgi:hypothetical protein